LPETGSCRAGTSDTRRISNPNRRRHKQPQEASPCPASGLTAAYCTDIPKVNRSGPTLPRRRCARTIFHQPPRLVAAVTAEATECFDGSRKSFPLPQAIGSNGVRPCHPPRSDFAGCPGRMAGFRTAAPAPRTYRIRKPGVIAEPNVLQSANWRRDDPSRLPQNTLPLCWQTLVTMEYLPSVHLKS
jgi:hypothetical protein